MDETKGDYMMQNKPVLQGKELHFFFCHLWNLRKGKRIQKQWGNVLFDIHQTARCWEFNLNFGLYLIISILPSHLQQRYNTKASCSRGRTFWEVKMVGWLDGALRVSAYKFSNFKTTLKTRKIKRWGEVSFTHVGLLCMWADITVKGIILSFMSTTRKQRIICIKGLRSWE